VVQERSDPGRRGHNLLLRCFHSAVAALLQTQLPQRAPTESPGGAPSSLVPSLRGLELELHLGASGPPSCSSGKPSHALPGLLGLVLACRYVVGFVLGLLGSRSPPLLLGLFASLGPLLVL